MSTVPTYGRRAGDGTLSPLAARLTRVAGLIKDEDLPDEGTVAVSLHSVTVSATYCSLPENVVRRWAQALGFVVTETPFDWQGAAATLFQAGGLLDGVSWTVHAIVPLDARYGDDIGRTDQVRNDSPVKVLATLGGA